MRTVDKILKLALASDYLTSKRDAGSFTHGYYQFEHRMFQFKIYPTDVFIDDVRQNGKINREENIELFKKCTKKYNEDRKRREANLAKDIDNFLESIE